MRRGPRIVLAGALLLYVGISVTAIHWGLPSRQLDPLLFGGAPAWSGEKIYDLAGGDAWSSPTRGADVDADPLAAAAEPVNLTATDRGVAAIYLRYRLYTCQPDEMITMRALGAMRPGRLQLDPKLYQYGGLFLYPVGALLKLCGLMGLIDVRGDVVYYLDYPDEFGKFYIVARAYAAAWGAVGLLAAYAIARRLAGAWAGALAALLLAVMPVVICMSHEGKPHLPGAALMLLAVLAAMRYVQSGRSRDRVLLAVACGAAFGMVLSSAPILVLIPLAERLRRKRPEEALLGTLTGGLMAAGVYLAANPYILINAFANPDVLRSNFANSLAMYEVARIGRGLLHVLELTVEGASLPIVLAGLIAFAAAVRRKAWNMLPLAVPTAVVLLQFILLGAGKPAEYGRFGVFPDAALAIATACGIAGAWNLRYRRIKPIAGVLIFAWVASSGWPYLANFRQDAAWDGRNTRWQAAHTLAMTPSADSTRAVWVSAEPAPYGCPPLDFAHTQVWLSKQAAAGPPPSTGPFVQAYDGPTLLEPPAVAGPGVIDLPGDYSSPISWANKPFRILLPPKAP